MRFRKRQLDLAQSTSGSIQLTQGSQGNSMFLGKSQKQLTGLSTTKHVQALSSLEMEMQIEKVAEMKNCYINQTPEGSRVGFNNQQ